MMNWSSVYPLLEGTHPDGMERTLTDSKPVILIVDDDDMVRRTVRRALGSVSGITVLDTANGTGAVAAVQANHVILVILDGRLIGEFGYDIADRLRAAGYTGPIAAHTTEGGEIVTKMLAPDRCGFLIPKPDDGLTFQAAARWALRRAEQDPIRLLNIGRNFLYLEAMRARIGGPEKPLGLSLETVMARDMAGVVAYLSPMPKPMHDLLIVDIDHEEFPPILNLLCMIRDQGFTAPIIGRTRESISTLTLPTGVFTTIVENAMDAASTDDLVITTLKRAHIIF